MLEKLTGYDYVKARVVEGKRLFGVGPHWLDAKTRRYIERLIVDVDPNNIVAVGVCASEGSITAANVEHAAMRPADVATEEFNAVFAAEDEFA